MYVEKLDLFSVLFFSLFRDFMQMAGRKNTWDSISYQQDSGYESFLFNLELHIRMYYLAACSHFHASVFIDIIHSFSASTFKTFVWRSEYSFSGSKDIL